MSDDVIPLPPGDNADPGEYRIVGGKRYVTCAYFEVDKEVTLPNGRTFRVMQALIAESMLTLYATRKGRDN